MNSEPQYSSGMDPEVKRYFRKIVRTVTWGMIWLMTMATAGIFFRLGFVADGFAWYNIVFYAMLVLSLGLLLRFFYRTWR